MTFFTDKGYLLLAVYLLAVNLYGFFLMGWDKKRSKTPGAWRIPEKRFFITALLGGSLGATWGMHFFRHKTKHWYFRFGLPLILAFQILLAGWLLTRFYMQ